MGVFTLSAPHLNLSLLLVGHIDTLTHAWTVTQRLMRVFLSLLAGLALRRRMDLIERGNQRTVEKVHRVGWERGFRINSTDPWGGRPPFSSHPGSNPISFIHARPCSSPQRTTISQLLWDSNGISLALIGLRLSQDAVFHRFSFPDPLKNTDIWNIVVFPSFILSLPPCLPPLPFNVVHRSSLFPTVKIPPALVLFRAASRPLRVPGVFLSFSNVSLTHRTETEELQQI